MLEILYEVATKEVRAWNGDMFVKGNLKPREGQEVVIFDIDPPDFESDIYYVDLLNKQIIGNPNYIEPQPPRDLAAEVDEIKAKIADYDNLKAKVEKLEIK